MSTRGVGLAGAARSEGARHRRGRVRAWVPFLLLFAAGVWICEALASGVWASGFTTIDTRRACFLDPADVEGGGGFVDQRWEGLLRQTLASVPAFDATDLASAELLRQRVTALAFIAEVGEPRVLWPDGVELPVKLRRPAACVRVGEEYLAVSSDGVLLPGGWPAPPWIGHGFLPVIGPNDHAFDATAPGMRLVEARHLDALSVAVSMRAALSAAEFETLGPPLVDATRARFSSATEPGVQLRLSDQRVIWFGRAPNAGEPGELSVEAKWKAVVEGARVLREAQGARDWSVLDARWDVPQIQWRESAGG
ncbi:MAG: hypothetical protein HZA53_07680 [Planctomycetes bacterium]|nr:hypothetical protein [Planctomycetota bacterium]